MAKSLFIIVTLLVAGFFAEPSIAQIPTSITPDGTLGTNVTTAGSTFNIDGGTVKGTNQFHSFDRFSVGTGHTASFHGPSAIHNILSRVTGLQSGLQQSVINGTLQSTIQGANLYLLNPAGILFGPNATLNVSGSFNVTTADFLRLEDGAEFHADLSKTSTLTISPPAAFGFLNENPAGITVAQSSLDVPVGKTLSLIGGDITITGDVSDTTTSLKAPEGQIQIASIATAGEQIPIDLMHTPELTTTDTAERFGKINLSQGAFIDASGDGGGVVIIRGGQFVMDDSRIFADTLADGPPGAVIVNVENLTLMEGGRITSDSVGPGQGGSVSVTASDTVTLTGTTPDGTIPSGLFANALSIGETAGNAGNVVVEAMNVIATDLAAISSTTFGPGQGGTVRVTASDSITLSGSLTLTERSGIFAATLGEGDHAGNAGNVIVKTKNLSVIDGATIATATFGPGQGGSLSVKIGDTLTLSGISPDGAFESGIIAEAHGRESQAGDAGNIVVAANNIAIRDGATISGTTFGPGQGGNMSVTVKDTLTLSGTSPDSTLQSGLFANAQGRGKQAGNAGNVIVDAANVIATDLAAISSSTFGPGQGGTVSVTASDSIILSGSLTLLERSGIFAATLGAGDHSGNAGDVLVEAKNVTVTDGAAIATATAGPGQGGAVTVTASDSIILSGATHNGEIPSGLFASAQGGSGSTGNAGDIFLSAGEKIVLQNNSAITTEARNADGGNITLMATELIHVVDSKITSSVGGGPTTEGGNIVLDPRFIVLDNSTILANAFEGKGGNITLNATDAVLVDPTSRVDASSKLGVDGAVAIEAPIQNLSGAIAPLPQNFQGITTLFSERCAAQKGGQFSSFAVETRDALPPTPAGFLPSPLGRMPSSSIP